MVFQLNKFVAFLPLVDHNLTNHFLDYKLFNHTCPSPNAEKCASVPGPRLSRFLMACTPQNPLLPVTVQDQIRLWELEKNRLKSQEGVICRKIILSHFLNIGPCFRLPLYCICLTGRLRICTQLRQGAGCRVVGKQCEKVLLRKFGWTCKYQRVHRTKDQRRNVVWLWVLLGLSISFRFRCQVNVHSTF